MTESFVRAIKRVGHWPANVALLAVGYWVAVRVGLFLVVQPEGVASIWPASGVALAALLLNPRRRWPVLLAVIFLVNAGGNWSGGNPLSASLGFALANTLEPLFAGWVLTHFCGERITFRRIKEMVVLFAAATLCNGVTALVGAGVAALAFDAPLMSTWWVWWASDGLGMAMVTAVIVTWVADPAVLRSASWMRLAEAVVFVIAVTGLTWLVFAPFTVAEHSVLRAYMLLPLIAWIAFRFSPRDTAGTLLLIALIALWNTRQGYGIFAFAADSPSERLVAVQTFLILLTLLGLLLSAETFERREAAGIAAQERGRAEEGSAPCSRRQLDVGHQRRSTRMVGRDVPHLRPAKGDVYRFAAGGDRRSHSSRRSRRSRAFEPFGGPGQASHTVGVSGGAAGWIGPRGVGGGGRVPSG